MSYRRLFCYSLFAVTLVGAGFLTSSMVKAEDGSGETAVESKVTEVTLYRTQALVTRTVEIEGEPGASEIVVSDLPENIDPSTMFAEGGDGIEVRAVRYRARAVSSSPREEVRVLEQEIASIEERREIVTKELTLLKKQSEYLDKLENFTASTADFDLGRGVLDAETVEKMTTFSFSQRQEILEQEVKFSKEQTELRSTLELAKRKIREITNGSTKQERQAVLFTQKTKPGKQTIRLNYLTKACSWSPTYTVRAESGSESVSVEYNGLIQQMSGEDWQGVKLTLSTASPALSAAGPGLAPFRLTLVPGAMGSANAAPFGGGGPGMGMGGMGVPAQTAQQAQVAMLGAPTSFKALAKVQNEALNRNLVATSNADNLKTSWTINNVVNNFDCFAITSDSPTNQMKMPQAAQGEEPALTWQIESPVSLQSRNSQQMVRVLTAELKSDFYHIATPVLTSYVYRETELLNDSQSDFLEGPLTVYLDGRFVGRSEIPTVARGQNFVVGLGADSQLRSRRELVDRSNRINGGNRETTLEYKLTVENYKDAAVNIRVVDRMPIVDEQSNIRVTLGEGVKDGLSDDGVYVRTLYPKGILRWDTEVEGRSIGEKAREIEYSFKLEHDRQYVVSLPGNLQEQETEYNELENRRRGGKRR